MTFYNKETLYRLHCVLFWWFLIIRRRESLHWGPTTKFLFLEASKVEHKKMNAIPIPAWYGRCILSRYTPRIKYMRDFYLSSSAWTYPAPATISHRVQSSAPSGEERQQKVMKGWITQKKFIWFFGMSELTTLCRLPPHPPCSLSPPQTTLLQHTYTDQRTQHNIGSHSLCKRPWQW